MEFRWLGVAGIELRSDGQILAIDPYFTRMPLRRMLGRMQSDGRLVVDQVARCDFVLVTHPHYDHLADVPEVVHNTGAAAFGSANACRLLAALGVPARQVRPIRVGDSLALGNFRVEVLPGKHGKVPLAGLFNRRLSPRLRPPLHAWDYRMDCCFSFLVHAAGYRVLVGLGEYPEEATPADVLCVGVINSPECYRSLLQRARPQIVVPIHWDDFFRPLSKPIRPMLAPPAWTIPPLRRIDLAGFAQMIRTMSPATEVMIPEIFHPYRIVEIVPSPPQDPGQRQGMNGIMKS
jgi:L-ascorbate metabolism protein UlaG (beta-lactamase superfamily)